MLRKSTQYFSPGALILSSFLFVIALGTLFLSMPFSRTGDFNFFELLFLATSTTCVTGLSPLPLTKLTLIGKTLILALIQIGGLGLMTLSFSAISLFMNFGIADHVAASKLLDFEYWSKIKRLLMIIIVVTVFFEVLGTAILYPLMRQHFGPDEAFFNALFFAISAFCNAGISPIGQEIYQFTNSYLILSTLGLLVFAGSLGFFVWQDLFFLAKRKLDSKHTLKKVPILSLHSKIALTTSFLLVIAATFLFWFFERGQTLSALPAVGQWVNAWFNATALRCSGFTTLNYQQVAIPTKLIALFLMMIGANPVSTGSGIKTTTVALTFATLMSTIRNKAYVEIFGRTIPTDLVNKSLSLIVLSFGWVSLSTFVLCMTDPHLDLFGIFFESVASFSTCGITAGITEQLSDLGKSMLIANMIVGRVGILTLLFAFARRTESQSYRYPQERILIG